MIVLIKKIHSSYRRTVKVYTEIYPNLVTNFRWKTAIYDDETRSRRHFDVKNIQF